MLVSQEICKKLSDAEIVIKSIEDIDFFACLYGRYEAKLFRYIKRISALTDEEAEDVLQESFIKIWKNINEFDQGLKLSSWVYRIVHNEAVSYWRKKRSYGKDKKVDFDQKLYENIPEDFELEDLSEQKSFRTHEILEALPLKYKEVLILKFFEMMSYEEISDVLKIPEGTVATRINRAKKAFANKIGGKPGVFT